MKAVSDGGWYQPNVEFYPGHVAVTISRLLIKRYPDLESFVRTIQLALKDGQPHRAAAGWFAFLSSYLPAVARETTVEYFVYDHTRLEYRVHLTGRLLQDVAEGEECPVLRLEVRNRDDEVRLNSAASAGLLALQELESSPINSQSTT